MNEKNSILFNFFVNFPNQLSSTSTKLLRSRGNKYRGAEMLNTAEGTMMEWRLCKQVRAGAAGTFNFFPLRHLHSHSSSLMHSSKETERTQLNVCHSAQMLESQLRGSEVCVCVCVCS